MRRLKPLAILMIGLSLAGAGSDPAERLSDPAKEARARALFRELRCVVCQNESVDDSEADLAGDIRRIVREQVEAGRSDEEVLAFLTDRYGEFVLLRPTLNPANLALWLIPPGLLLAGGLALFLQSRKPRGADAPLSDEEEAGLAVLLARNEDDTVPPQNGP